jgi:DNA ligase-1
MNREFLQLAHDYDTNKHSIHGWMMSEKLDGMRAFWDGGVSRGRRATEIPWANTEKHDRFLNEVIATGLWSRYGQVIRAPDWWLDMLPSNLLLDGELYGGRGKFQFVMSTVKDHVGGDGWNDISYVVFDSPSVAMFTTDGRINNPNFRKQIDQQKCSTLFSQITQPKMFFDVYNFLKEKILTNKVLKIHPQTQLPYQDSLLDPMIQGVLEEITNQGGEGLMFRKGESSWYPKRTNLLLKMKKLQDAEATVVGYVTGRKTDRGSKLLGLMGALIVKWNNITFELSGFTDEERVFGDNLDEETAMMQKWAWENPGAECPDWVNNPKFPKGTIVTFRYRELTNDGVPKEARFWRKV